MLKNMLISFYENRKVQVIINLCPVYFAVYKVTLVGIDSLMLVQTY